MAIDREELMAFLREHLSIETSNESVYTGGLDDSGRLYKDYTRVAICLDGEVISETVV
jgi:hypothetical protein